MPAGGRTFSLRAHLLVLLVGTTVPALLIAALLVRQVMKDNRRAVQQQLQETARATAAVVDAELGGTIRALEGLAQSDRLTNGELPLFYAQATRLLAMQPAWSAVSLSTLDGRQAVNTARGLDDTLPELTDHDSFERAIRTQMPAIGSLRVGSITHNWGFLVRVPVIRDRRVLYVLSVWITSDAFARVVLRDTGPFGGLMRGVVDSGGTVVVRAPNPERFVGRTATQGFLQRYRTAPQGLYRDTTLEGTPVYSAYSRAPMSGWVAAVAAPVMLVDQPFRDSMVSLAVAALLLLGVGGGGTYVISRRMARDISASATAAESIAQGQAPPPAVSRVTELQRLSDALAQSMALLETRQQERDEQLARADDARARAERADRAKDEFLALLGHELRNPLSPALTAIHLMKIRSGGEASRERDVLERQIRHMARLVDDLLDVARLRRGAIELRRERFDLSEAISRAIEMTTPLVAERQHHLQVDVATGLTVDGDPVRLAQVVSNLLSNAAKYTNPGGQIVLRAWADQGQAVVECRDDGIGMSPHLRERAFELFVQGQQGLDRRQGGLGLGLAVAKALIELHHGTIEAHSDGPGRGSTFVVRLPLATQSSNAAGRAHGEGDGTLPLPRASVLVVDDNRDARETLLDALRAAGLDAIGAPDASEALDLASRRRPDVALLDIGLPEMNGFDLARALRGTPGLDTLRIVALTGYGRDQDREAARTAGFDAFLVKPVDVPALLETLRTVLEPPVANSRSVEG